MKKILYYTLSMVLLPLILVGCKIDSGERNDKKTIYGYNMFSYVLSDFSENYMITYDAINLNAYITAPNEQAKVEILDKYFKGFRIEALNNNKYVIVDQTQILMSVQTDGRTIDDLNARWSVESYIGRDFRLEPFTITNTGADSWTIQRGGGLIDAKRVQSALEYQLSFTTVDFISNTSNERNTLQCNELVYNFNLNSHGRVEFIPISGWAKVSVNGGTKPENVVEGTFFNNPTFELQLTYRGLTETYDYWDQWYMYY